MNPLYKLGKKVVKTYKGIRAWAYNEMKCEESVNITPDQARYISSKICHSAAKLGCMNKLEEFVVGRETKTQIPTFLGDRIGRDYEQIITDNGGIKLVFEKSKYTLDH
jgi:hypothetical protein